MDDDDLTPAQLIAQERAAMGADSGLNSGLRGGPPARMVGAPQPSSGFGLDSEPVGRPAPPRSGATSLGAPPPLRGTLPAVGRAPPPPAMSARDAVDAEMAAMRAEDSGFSSGRDVYRGPPQPLALPPPGGATARGAAAVSALDAEIAAMQAEESGGVSSGRDAGRVPLPLPAGSRAAAATSALDAEIAAMQAEASGGFASGGRDADRAPLPPPVGTRGAAISSALDAEIAAMQTEASGGLGSGRGFPPPPGARASRPPSAMSGLDGLNAALRNVSIRDDASLASVGGGDQGGASLRSQLPAPATRFGLAAEGDQQQQQQQQQQPPLDGRPQPLPAKYPQQYPQQPPNQQPQQRQQFPQQQPSLQQQQYQQQYPQQQPPPQFRQQQQQQQQQYSQQYQQQLPPSQYPRQPGAQLFMQQQQQPSSNPQDLRDQDYGLLAEQRGSDGGVPGQANSGYPSQGPPPAPGANNAGYFGPGPPAFFAPQDNFNYHQYELPPPYHPRAEESDEPPAPPPEPRRPAPLVVLQQAMMLPQVNMGDIPPDQRFIQMPPKQADGVIAAMMARQDGGPLPRVVDVKEAHKKLRETITADVSLYLRALELHHPAQRFPVFVRPSLLQTKLKRGRNKLRTLVEPLLDPGNQGFKDLTYNHEGALVPEMENVWQFGLALVKADGVGQTGLLTVRQPCLYLARMALFDRQHNRFLGNVLGVRPVNVKDNEASWIFNPTERAIVRCGMTQWHPSTGNTAISDEHISVYIEFNVSYRLTVEDTKAMPPSEDKASRMLDEVTTCWALVALHSCTMMAKETEVSVPLHFGSIYRPQSLDEYYKAERKKDKGVLRSLLRPARVKPTLTFRVGPLMPQNHPLMPFGYMPATMLALTDLACALGAFRMNLGLLLARQPTPFAPLADPVLAAFPDILADGHLLKEFLVKYSDLTTKLLNINDGGCLTPLVAPPLATLIEAFRRCTVEVSPLLRCPTLPPRHISNFLEYQGHRLKLVQHFCHTIDPVTNVVTGGRHPVEPLSHAGFEYLHRPFDVAEMRLCIGDRLERPPNFMYN